MLLNLNFLDASKYRPTVSNSIQDMKRLFEGVHSFKYQTEVEVSASLMLSFY